MPSLLCLFALLSACRPAAEDDTQSTNACDVAPPAATPILDPACLVETARAEGEEALVYDSAWSPGGEFLLTGGISLLRLYAVGEGGTPLTLLDAVSSESRFNSVLWSGDGRLAIAPTGKRVLLFAADAGALELAYEGPEEDAELQRVALSPDEQRLLSCDRDGVTRLYRVGFDPPEVEALDQVQAHADRCTRVAWSPSGRLALSAAYSGELVLYRVGGDTLEIADVYPYCEEIGEAIFGRDDGEAIAGSFGAANALWTLDIDPDAGTLSIRQTLTEHASGVGALSFDHAQGLLLTGGHDDTLHLYRRLADGSGLERVLDVPDDGAGVHSARWSPDDTLVARTASNVDRLYVMRVGDCPAP